MKKVNMILVVLGALLLAVPASRAADFGSLHQVFDGTVQVVVDAFTNAVQNPETIPVAGNFWDEVKIGKIKIVPIKIVLGIAVFIAVLVLSKLIQRVLLRRVLPKTKLEVGERYTIAASVNYIGIIVASVAAVVSAGVDLSGLALVAGALSVGIGFGLQNVVNNFVSGIILLFERPIKVGDWVVINGNEGIVKRTAIRATELETFDRGVIIIPNADLIANPIINWTHNNPIARVRVKVGVAYGSDTAIVRDLLLAVAAQHQRVLQTPAPYVWLEEFGESALIFSLYAFADDAHSRATIASELRFMVDAAFRAQGIEVPFPQRVVRHVNAAGQIMVDE